MQDNLISIIIRTKNEERWIGICIEQIKKQSYSNYEIILVDSISEDKTVEKAKRHGVNKVVKVKEYKPGKAINMGIKASKGEFIVILSAHCLPINNEWLKDFYQEINSDISIAGVYGKQVPMDFSSDEDKRDLLIVFGEDERIQKKDSFFHNANSIIRRDVWDQIKFDNNVDNIEDRIWAEAILKKNFKIKYTPKAPVYHYHGIHQSGNIKRLEGVTKIIENLSLAHKPGVINHQNFEKSLVIPIKGEIPKFNNKNLLEYMSSSIFSSKLIDSYYVATDNEETAKVAKSLGYSIAKIRDPSLSSPKTSLEDVHYWHLNVLENELRYFPDIIIHAEITFPFRDNNLIDALIKAFLKSGADTVMPAKPEFSWAWQEQSKNDLVRLDEGDVPREFKKSLLLGSHGLGCVSHAEVIRRNTLVGDKVHLMPINNQLNFIEVRTQENANYFSKRFKNV